MTQINPTRPKLYIRRQGGVLTIFVDPANNMPQPFYAWGEEPEHAFPMVPTRQELAAFLAVYDPVYIDPPAKNQKTEVPTQAEEMEAAKMLGEAPKRVASPSLEAKAPTVRIVDAAYSKAELLNLFRQIEEQDVEAVGSFLIALDPELELELMKARLPKSKKRFSLAQE